MWIVTANGTSKKLLEDLKEYLADKNIDHFTEEDVE